MNWLTDVLTLHVPRWALLAIPAALALARYSGVMSGNEDAERRLFSWRGKDNT